MATTSNLSIKIKYFTSVANNMRHSPMKEMQEVSIFPIINEYWGQMRIMWYITRPVWSLKQKTHDKATSDHSII